MSPADLISFGALGIITGLWLLGWLEPKPATDERRLREKAKDEIIVAQNVRLDRQAETLDKVLALLQKEGAR